jgi:hypothetical protein
MARAFQIIKKKTGDPMFKPSILAVLMAAAGLAQAANPITNKIFTADPAALVDKGRVYLYVGHDEAKEGGKDYLMNEWRVFSSCDMKNWTEAPDPVPYTIFKWAGRDAWAGDIAKRNGKYYLYTTVDHKSIPGKAIGVAVSNSPLGPFVDARGSALVTNDMTGETPIAWDDIDPAVFIDDDGQAWLYWGNTVMKYAKLKPNMTELDGPIHTVGLDSLHRGVLPAQARRQVLPLLFAQVPGRDGLHDRPDGHRPVVLRRRHHGAEQQRQDHPPRDRRLQRQVLHLLSQWQAAGRRRVPPLRRGRGAALQRRTARSCRWRRPGRARPPILRRRASDNFGKELVGSISILI